MDSSRFCSCQIVQAYALERSVVTARRSLNRISIRGVTTGRLEPRPVTRPLFVVSLLVLGQQRAWVVLSGLCWWYLFQSTSPPDTQNSTCARALSPRSCVAASPMSRSLSLPTGSPRAIASLICGSSDTEVTDVCWSIHRVVYIILSISEVMCIPVRLFGSLQFIDSVSET